MNTSLIAAESVLRNLKKTLERTVYAQQLSGNITNRLKNLPVPLQHYWARQVRLYGIIVSISLAPAELGQWQSNETIHLSSKMAALVRQTIYLNVKANNLLRYQGRGVGSVAKNLPYTLSDQRLTLCLNPSLEVSVKLLVKFISIKILLTPFCIQTPSVYIFFTVNYLNYHTPEV